MTGGNIAPVEPIVVETPLVNNSDPCVGLGYGLCMQMNDNGSSYSESCIQYGGGFSVSATDNVDVFLDYTRFYDDSGFDTLTSNDNSVIGFTDGASYKF